MSWPVYSVVFIRATLPSTTYSWVVPAGKTAILTHVAAVALAASNSGFNVSIAGVLVFNWSTTVQYSEHLVQTRLVANAGDSLNVTTGDGATHVTACGYLLTNTTTAYNPLDDVQVREREHPETLPELVA